MPPELNPLPSAEAGASDTPASSEEPADAQPAAPAAELELPEADLPGLPTRLIVTETPPLSPADEVKAREFWRKWRDSWSQFKGLSGNVEIECFDEKGEPFTLRASIELRSDPADARFSDDPQHYWPDVELILTDADNQWSYKCAMYGDEQLECKDSGLEQQLKSALNKSLAVIMVDLQWTALDPFCSAGPDPSGRGKSFFDHHPPSSNPDARGESDSYVFAPTVMPKSGARGSFYFVGGDLAKASYNREGDAIGNTYYGEYEEIGAMRFPTSMKFDLDRFKYNLKFSNLTVEVVSVK